MNAESDPAYRERVAVLGRVALVASMAPALFFIWHAIGLPAPAGVHFGNPVAPANSGLVVRVPGDLPSAVLLAGVSRARPATAPPARRSRATTSVLSTAASPPLSRPQALSPATAAPVSNPPAPKPSDPTPPTESPAAPDAGTPAGPDLSTPAAGGLTDTPPAQTAATVEVTLTVQPPPLPVRLPAVSIPVALPRLPLAPVVRGIQLPGLP